MDGSNILVLFLIIYTVCHLPAIIALVVAFRKRKTNPNQSKKLLIFAVVYFIVGAGICGGMLGG